MQSEVHPDAGAEIRSAALWYELKGTSLGDDFVAAVHEAIERILERPENHPRWPGTENATPVIRKARVHRFPYLIAYELRTDDRLIILAVAHEARRPLYWIERRGQDL